MKSDVLSTRQVAQLLGVGEATVKRWADAGEIDCFRTPGGHRKFRLRDVTAFVQKKDLHARGPLPTGVPPGADDLGDRASSHFEARALAGDTSALVAQLSALRLRGHELAEIFDGLVQPALEQVGSKWAEHKLSIAEEHIASQSVIDCIARCQPLAEPPGEPVRPDRGTAIVCAVSGELHDIGARMAATLLRARAFEVLAPLAQTPAKDLAEMIGRTRAALVAIGATMVWESDVVKDQVEMAAAAAQRVGGRMLVGGTGMQEVQLPDGVIRCRSMTEMVAASEQAGRKHRTRPGQPQA